MNACSATSRDFIHEPLLVFFTLAVPVSVLRYRDTLMPTYLMLASAAAALMFATKETAAISAVVLLLALLAELRVGRCAETSALCPVGNELPCGFELVVEMLGTWFDGREDPPKARRMAHVQAMAQFVQHHKAHDGKHSLQLH